MMHAELSAIDACVFDAYGTLFDVGSAAKRCADVLGAKADTLAVQWRTSQLHYTWLRSLMGRHADFWQVTGDALDFAMDALGIADTALRKRLMDLYLELSAYPDAAVALTALRQVKRPAAILSNGTPKMLAAAVKSAGLAALLHLGEDHLVFLEDSPSPVDGPPCHHACPVCVLIHPGL